MARKPDQPYVPDGQAARLKSPKRSKSFVIEYKRKPAAASWWPKDWVKWSKYHNRRDAQNAVMQLSKAFIGHHCDFRIKKDGE